MGYTCLGHLKVRCGPSLPHHAGRTGPSGPHWSRRVVQKGGPHWSTLVQWVVHAGARWSNGWSTPVHAGPERRSTLVQRVVHTGPKGGPRRSKTAVHTGTRWVQIGPYGLSGGPPTRPIQPRSSTSWRPGPRLPSPPRRRNAQASPMLAAICVRSQRTWHPSPSAQTLTSWPHRRSSLPSPQRSASRSRRTPERVGLSSYTSP